MKSRAWLIPALCGLIAAPAVVPAQENPGAGGMTLRFKHQAGKARKFRLGIKSDMTMTPDGNGGGVVSLPMTLKSTAFFTEKVQSVDAGSAALLVTPLTMTMDTGAFGMNILLKMEKGKLTMNGQEVGADSPLAPVASMLSDKPVALRRSALGEVTMPADATGLSQMLSSSFLLQLPEQAVKVGDSWETSAKGQAQLPLGGGGAPGLPELEIRLTHTLKGLEKAAGKTLAVIDTAGAAGVQGGEGEGTQKYSGTTRFDVTQGAIQSASYKADMKMKVALPAALGGGAPGAAPEGGAPAEGGTGSMRIDGLMVMNLSEVVPPPVKPAAKPAAKKPVRKPAKRK